MEATALIIEAGSKVADRAKGKQLRNVRLVVYKVKNPVECGLYY